MSIHPEVRLVEGTLLIDSFEAYLQELSQDPGRSDYQELYGLGYYDTVRLALAYGFAKGYEAGVAEP